MSVTRASLLGDTFGSSASGTIPVGGIIMWSGSTIPTGWSICNGTNGTPDLRDKFIVGAGSGYNVGATGGSADAIVPYHNHTATSTGTFLTDATLSTTIRKRGANVTSLDEGPPGIDTVDAASLSTSSGSLPNPTVNYEGTLGNTTNANLPPYYALAFIMRVS